MRTEWILALLAAAAAPDGPDERPLATWWFAAPQLASVVALAVAILLGAVGLGLTVLALAPERHRLAAQRVGARPFGGLILGIVILVPLGLLAAAMARHHLPGRRLVISLAAYALAGGWSVAARTLGDRAAPDAGAVVQTLIGSAALLSPILVGVGIPVALIAAPLGLGAWLLARRG